MNLEKSALTAEATQDLNPNTLKEVKNSNPSDKKILDFIIEKLGYF